MAGTNREVGGQPEMMAAGRRGVRGAAHAAHAATDAAASAVEAFSRNAAPFMEAFNISAQPMQAMAQQSSRTIEVMTQCGTVLSRGMQDIARAWMGVAQAGLQHQLEGFQALARARSPQEFVTVQTDLVRSNVETVLNGSRRVAELSAQMAEETAQTVAGQVQEATRRADRAA